jgi:tetratricopeptide (TPR) repeat protein
MLRTQEINGVSSQLEEPLSITAKFLIGGGITALLFGVHPLHVESVAWVAERKDLLCSFFVLLSILSYLSYTSSVVTRHRWIWFTTCFIFFVLALMSKPMAVSLPLILLLLDFYPLKRLKPSLHKNLYVILEKIPFFILSIASGVITIIAQHSGGAIESFERLPISFRLLNALNSLVFYLKKMIFPLELIPFYPFPKYPFFLDLHYLISGILILAITGYCLWIVQQGKYLFFTAWFFYLITLLPVIGIIQVGGQAAADRYTYLPSISLFFLIGMGVVWGWKKISLTRFKVEFRVLLLVCLCIVALSLSYLTINQIKIWRNQEIFWNHIISIFPKILPEAYHHLGVAHAKKGKLDEAIAEYKQALTIDSNRAKTRYNLGLVYVRKGKLDEAISEYKQALRINPNLTDAYISLGVAYHKKRDFDKAILEYKRAIAIKPYYALAHNNLSLSYYLKGNYKLATLHCDKAIELGYNVNLKLLELLKPYR